MLVIIFHNLIFIRAWYVYIIEKIKMDDENMANASCCGGIVDAVLLLTDGYVDKGLIALCIDIHTK